MCIKPRVDYPALRKLGNSTALEVEAEDSEVQGHGGQPWVPDQLGIHETLPLEKKKKKPCKTNQLVKHKGIHVNEIESSVCVSSYFVITNSSAMCDDVCLYSAYLPSNWQEHNCFSGQPGLCTASHCLRKELLLGHSPRWICGHYRSGSCWVRDCGHWNECATSW